MNLTNTIAVLALVAAGCAQTSHTTQAAALGQPADWASFVDRLDAPGPIEFERIIAADWEVPRSGLINLKNDAAQAAGLEDGPEPIQIYMYAIRHPQHGLFLIDTGVDRATAEGNKREMAASWLVRSAMKLDKLRVHVDTATWVARQTEPLAGVFLTHMHLDHAMGLPDVPDDVPIYTGPGEAGDSKFQNVFVRGTTNRTLRGKSPVRELSPAPVAGSGFDGLVDVFGDGSMLAIHIPGHTVGSMAFLIRTTAGPVLLTGDGSHTAWGWDHGVESGTYNGDTEAARKSFLKLQRFAEAHPEVALYLGHQDHVSHASAESATPGQRTRLSDVREGLAQGQGSKTAPIVDAR